MEPNVFIGFSQVISKNDKKEVKNSIFFEYQIDRAQLRIVNGWDRFNKYEVKDKFKFANLIRNTFTIGWSYSKHKSSNVSNGHIYLFLSYSISKFWLKPIADNSNFQAPNYFSIGLS